MSATILPGYGSFLEELKAKIKSAQIKAALTVNAQMLTLYWDLGKAIVEKSTQAGWGNAVVEQLSKDLTQDFPTLKGFSRTNLYAMRSWYLFYGEQDPIVPQLVGQIPWGHNRLIIDKIKDRTEALFYVQQTIQNGWSRDILAHQIQTKLFARQGKAISNFTQTLPKPQSDLATQTLKDPYIFDFLSLTDEAHERELEKALVSHITKFLLELGAGFAFVGQQYHLEVDGDDYYIDLLFYHVKLHCYVAIELKIGEFKPEYAGKLNFYLSALDSQVKSMEDKPSIGMILCRSNQKKVTAEYALRDMNKPIGIAEYRFTEALPENIRTELPTIEELEEELKKLKQDGRA
jgi:predicted nuclease of restriction endonuclease-like (RecB) superfamily